MDIPPQMLTNVAYDVYESVMVVTMNIDQRPWWAEQFVPAEHRPLGTGQTLLVYLANQYM